MVRKCLHLDSAGEWGIVSWFVLRFRREEVINAEPAEIAEKISKALLADLLGACLAFSAFNHSEGNAKANSLSCERLSWGRDLGEAPVPQSINVSDYFGCCCWSIPVAGGALLESCSKSFFSKLISTRPPLVCFGLSASSAAVGALPMPTR